MNYKIIDNFLEKENFQFLQKVLFSEDTPWFYKDAFTIPRKNTEHAFYNHCIYSLKQPQSKLFDYMNVFIEKLKIVAIDEIRVNSMYVQKDHYESEWHIDRPFKCKTGIFYLNTCNGYTLLKTNSETKIDSLENRMLIFDSQIEHKGVSQTDTRRRMVINFNYFDNPCAFTVK